MTDHYYSNFDSPKHLHLINSKNRGGLVLPSKHVVHIVNICERVFRVSVCGVDSKMQKVSSRKNLKFLMVHLINQELASKYLFPELNEHDVEHEMLTEDLHSSQLLKTIIEKYVTLRLLTYGKHYTKDVVHKDKIGVRQQSTKLVLFKGI